MAEIVFNNEMQNFLNTLETRMVESTYESINKKKVSVIYKVIDSVRDNLNRYKDSLVENLTDDKIEQKVEEYFQELKDFEHNHINKIIESVRQATDSVIHQAENKSERQLESTFTFLMHEIVRRQNVTLHEDLNYEFSSKMANFLTSRYDYNYNIAYAVSNVQTEVGHILKKMSEEVIEELQVSLNSYARYYIERTIEVISEQNKENGIENKEEVKEERVNQETNNLFVSSNDVSKYTSLASKMGLKIEETFDGYTITTPNDGKTISLYKNASGNLYTPDHSIELKDDDGISITIQDKIIREKDDTIYFGSLDNPNKVSLTNDFLEYEVRYGDVIQTDPLRKGIALSYIEKNFKEYYQELNRDALFQALSQEVDAADKKVEELYKDIYGVVHINKNNAEVFNDKVGALGYRAIEKDDGVYLIDRKGAEHHLQYESGYAYLEDEPTVGFNTNHFIVSENEIKGPRIDYHKADINLSIASDYMDLSLSGPNQTFFMGYGPDKKFKCVGNNAGTRIVNAEVVSFLSRFCPEALEKVKNTCLNYEYELKKRASEPTKKEEPKVTPLEPEVKVPSEPKVEEPTEVKEEAENLMNELDTSSEPLVKEENIDVNNMDDESIYQELRELENDPKVVRYMILLNVINDRYHNNSNNNKNNSEYTETNTHPHM